MLRSFGLQVLTGSAQPAFGDKITAAFVPPPDISKAFKLTVANSALYVNGDRIILGWGQAGANALLVIGQPDSTHILCMSEGGAKLKSWVVNSIISLDIACANVVFNLIVGNAGATWLGADSTVTNVGGGTAFWSGNGGSFYNLAGGPYNVLRTSEASMAGTLNDKVGVVAIVI